MNFFSNDSISWVMSLISWNTFLNTSVHMNQYNVVLRLCWVSGDWFEKYSHISKQKSDNMKWFQQLKGLFLLVKLMKNLTIDNLSQAISPPHITWLGNRLQLTDSYLSLEKKYWCILNNPNIQKIETINIRKFSNATFCQQYSILYL